MGDDNNGITSVMTPGYDYFCIFKCLNCGKESKQDYEAGLEFNPCPYCGYAIGIREKPIEKQTTLEAF